MPRRAITTLDDWCSEPEGMWCCSSKTIRRSRAALELFFEDGEADRRTWQTFEQVEKGHGRLEQRHITTSPDLNDYLAHDCGEVGQVFRLLRERTCKDKHSVEVVYG